MSYCIVAPLAATDAAAFASPLQEPIALAAFRTHTQAVYVIDLQVQDGDMIDIDVGKKAMTLEIPEQVPTAERTCTLKRVQTALMLS